MQTVHLSAHTNIAVVKTKIELDLHADTCVVGDHCLIVTHTLNTITYSSVVTR